MSARLCEVCEAVLEGGSTRTKRFCSDACRQSAYRERKEQQAVEKFAELLR